MIDLLKNYSDKEQEDAGTITFKRRGGNFDDSDELDLDNLDL